MSDRRHRLWGSRADRRTHAAVAMMLLWLLVGCGDSEPTFDDLSESLRECPRGDDPWRQALDVAEKEQRLESLIELARALEEQEPERWEPPWVVGQCLYRLQQPQESEAYSRAALEVAQRLDDPVGIASSANDLAWLAFTQGNLREGRELYREALEAATAADRVDLASFVRSNLAGLLIQLGEYAAAGEQLEHAEVGLRQIGHPDAARWAAYNRGVMLFALGDAVSAERVFRAVRDESQRVEDYGTVNDVAIELGRLELVLGDLAAARSWYEQVTAEDPESTARVALGLGWIAIREGSFETAARLLEPAAKGVREHNQLLAFFIETSLAEAEMRAGDFESARSKLQRVIEESERDAAEDYASLAHQLLGDLLLRERRFAEAVDHLERAVQVLDDMRSPFDPQAGIYFLRERADAYVNLAAALILDSERAGKPPPADRVLAIAGAAQAWALRQMLGQGFQAPRADNLESIQQAMSDDDLLLNYLIGEDRGVLLAITGEEVRALPIAGRRALLAPLQAYRDALRPGAPELAPEARLAGNTLREELLEPVQDLVSRARRLYVVPDRELALLPFSAIPLGDGATEGSYVGDAVEVAVLPTAGRPPQWSQPRVPVLLAGQPQHYSESAFGELPWAAYELSHLQRVWGPENVAMLRGEDLSLEKLQASPLGDFRTIHLATHAVASSRNPQRCGVILSGGERLGLDEIVDLDLTNCLVVLSACQTGEGELVPGEGVIGLGWSFLRAGADGVVASLWTVDDVATSKLMITFHEHLAEGTNPVRALALARRETARDHAHPSLWSPFILILRPD